MGFKSWFNAARNAMRRRFSRSRAREPTPEELSRIRRAMEMETSDGVKQHPSHPWPGFTARKKLTPVEFMEYISTHLDMRPPQTNRAAWKTIYEARLEVLKDKHLTNEQRVWGMSGHDKKVAQQALALGKKDIFNLCIISQVEHVQNRIDEFSS